MESPLREGVLRRARFSEELRAYFRSRGYAEVDTPILSPYLIPEPAIEVFQTEYLPARGSPRPMWLAPSPELWMKRLLAAGSGNIFQVSRSFRNGDYGGPLHNPEFRLLEWYTLGAGCLQSIEVTEELFSRLLASGIARRPVSELSPPFRRLTMEEAFREFARIDLASCQDAQSLAVEAARSGIGLEGPSTWEQAFHILFLTLVEPRLPRDRPLVLLDYPAQIPTTAHRRPGTPWAERWELFVDGVEIANVYTEETEAAVLTSLIREEAGRRAGSRTVPAVDEGFARAFPPGFPPCTGAALGVDRLEMVFGGEKSLEGVILFPFSAILDGQSEIDA
jgi:elongation factor P--(R)-beta-lysine ligase